MSDFSIRSRRRVLEDEYSSPVYEDHDLKKTQAVAGPSLAGETAQNFSYNPFNTVFSASPAQLWNSAQEAFKSISPPVTYFQPTSEVDEPTSESEFPKLAIFGDRVDFIVFNMPTRDRTNEFRTTAKSFQMKIQTNGIRHHDKKEVIVESVQFNQLAKRIGRDLSHTCAKMEKLAEMTKKKSLLDERSEMDRLSKVVTEDITALNKQIATLNEFSRRRKGGKHQQGYVHSENVVLGLQSKLATVGQDFKTVLEIGTENLKAQKSRREKFSHSNALPMSLPSSSGTPNSRSRLLLDEEYEKGNGSVALDMGAMEQFTSQQQVVRDQTGEYVRARSNAMETIEGSIHELGQIFSQLASLVSEQGEVITRIDSNVDDAAINIDAAHTELVRYFANISRNRWLIIKVLGTLMVFFIIFVVFLT